VHGVEVDLPREKREDDGDGPCPPTTRDHTSELGVSYFRYGPGFRSPMGHRHRVQEEAYVVVGGSGRMRLDDEIVDLRPWDVGRVSPEVTRGFEGGPDGLELIAIGGNKPEGGDGEAFRDWWTQ
jgi:mannose-6-phosphate isomerase-like protein (cupin superfamily)